MIKIKDNGIGIATEELSNIFNRFYQTPDSIHQQKEGTGIGLALTKELVELMEGTIQVNSQKGKGSEFIVQIPIHQNIPFNVQSDLLKKKNAILPTSTENLLPTNTKVEDNLPIVLIIEDNTDVAYFIGTCLENEYQVIYAKDGLIGVELALEKIPDVIISDVMMPKKDGFEVCQILKTDERTDHIPIILLTAKATLEDRLKGLKKGADAYLAKPFEKAELLIRLEKLRTIRKTLQQKYQRQLISPKIVENPPIKKDTFIGKIDEIILNNLDKEDFSVNDLAQQLHLSRSQVHRKVKALTGISTAIYIRMIRLEKAKKLLATKELSISEIAYQVGFKSPAYFSQVFKEAYGESPTMARK